LFDGYLVVLFSWSEVCINLSGLEIFLKEWILIKGRLIIYGDIHGCLDEFKVLRKKIKPTKKDIEVVVGDILNKGPFSLETLRYIIKKDILLVRGNNEDKILKLYKKNITEGIKPWEEKIVRGIKKGEIKFLKNLPYFLKFKNVTVIHGGIPFGVRLSKKLSKEKRKQLTLLRYYDKDLNILPWYEKDKRDKFWSELYDGRDGFVVSGHHPFSKPKIEKFAIDIDTGCVYGGKLTAIVFKKKKKIYDTKDYEIFSVKARKNYFL
jgi:predicted phosphodiesterase